MMDLVIAMVVLGAVFAIAHIAKALKVSEQVTLGSFIMAAIGACLLVAFNMANIMIFGIVVFLILVSVVTPMVDALA